MLKKISVYLVLICASVAAAIGSAAAVTLEPDERLNLRMVAPIPNNTPLRIWPNKYYPGDVLSEHMTDYLYQRLREVPRLNISKVAGSDPDRWAVSGYTPSDLVVMLTLEQANFQKKDNFGSNMIWEVVLHMHVFNALTKRIVYETVVREEDHRRSLLYTDTLETGPVFWDEFAKTPYWSAVRKALDTAASEVIDGYNGYRIIGRIVAKAERVDGSLTVPKKKRDKLYHVTLGREDSLRVGDLLSVTRSSSVRTVDPQVPELHFPQVVGRVKVLYLKGQDAIVEVIKESKEAPIMLGDSVSAPLHGKRGSRYY